LVYQLCDKLLCGLKPKTDKKCFKNFKKIIFIETNPILIKAANKKAYGTDFKLEETN
jgi:hypothetical protein